MTKKILLDGFYAELTRVVGERLPNSNLPVVYRKTILNILRKHYRNFPPYSVENEICETQITSDKIDVLDKWIENYPQYVFTLILGFESGLNENDSWGLAYG